MNRYLLRLRCVLLLVVILLGIRLIPAQFESSSESVTPEYYGRYALSQEPNSKALLYAYDQIVKGVGSASASISVYDGKTPLSVKELQTVYDAYVRDHTEHFWLGNTYTYSYNPTTVLTVKPDYLLTGSQLTSAKAAFESAVSDYLSLLNSSMSDFEKELILHDALARSITYTESKNAHNAYGAMVEGKAVCEGYAEALQYLLQRAGIQSFLAIGASVNPDSEKIENHEWNYVRIDGKYYHIDLTWDDQGDNIYHAYFNQSDAVISNDHQIFRAEYDLPVCSSAKAQYFAVMGGEITSGASAVDMLAQRLKNNGLKTSVYVTDEMTDFIGWMTSNISEIGKKAGVTGSFSYSYAYLGRELVLTLDSTCRHNDLKKVSAQNATCVEGGNSAYYVCACGKWFKDASAKTEITDKSSVNIAPLGHIYTEKIMDADHIKQKAANCGEYHIYWYDCSRCSAHAGKDASASDRYYTGEVAGSHSFTERKEDNAHLVAGSGADCRTVKQYYYDCAYCDRIGTEKWSSESYGDHLFSVQWKFDAEHHWKECKCTQRSELSAHTDTNGDGKCDVCLRTVGTGSQQTTPPVTTPTPSQTTPPVTTPTPSQSTDSPDLPDPVTTPVIDQTDGTTEPIVPLTTDRSDPESDQAPDSAPDPSDDNGESRKILWIAVSVAGGATVAGVAVVLLIPKKKRK